MVLLQRNQALLPLTPRLHLVNLPVLPLARELLLELAYAAPDVAFELFAESLLIDGAHTLLEWISGQKRLLDQVTRLILGLFARVRFG